MQKYTISSFELLMSYSIWATAIIFAYTTLHDFICILFGSELQMIGEI